MGQQNLADDIACIGEATHGSDLISGLALFDHGLAVAARPGIVIKWADHRPHFFGGGIEHDAVVGFFHCSKPRCARRADLLLASRPQARLFASFAAILLRRLQPRSRCSQTEDAMHARLGRLRARRTRPQTYSRACKKRMRRGPMSPY